MEIEKHQVQNLASLELNLEGANNVLYFTHDYFANAFDKNSSLVATARVAHHVGVERLVAVNPVELNLYYTEDEKQPLEKVNEAQ